MLKVFHCADIHLDSPFSLRRPSQAERGRTELRGAFSSALLFAATNKADLFLISGDLFDSEYVTADTRERLARGFASCPDCRFFISPGNHDPLTAGSPYLTASFPSNVHVFGAERERVDIPELGVTVYGQAFTSRRMLSSPVAGYGRLDPDRVNILVCHGEMTSGVSECGPVTERELAASGFDYVALGHIHKRSGLMRSGDTFWCYPGCLAGRSFDETGEKGAMFGTVGRSSADMHFVGFANLRYEIAEVQLESGMSRQEALAAVRAAIRKYGDNVCLRLILTGGTPEGVGISASDIGSGREYPCSIELIDRTVPEDIYSGAEKAGTLKGMFYALIKERLAECEPGSEDYAVCSEAARIGLAALGDRDIAAAEAEDMT